MEVDDRPGSGLVVIGMEAAAGKAGFFQLGEELEHPLFGVKDPPIPGAGLVVGRR